MKKVISLIAAFAIIFSMATSGRTLPTASAEPISVESQAPALTEEAPSAPASPDNAAHFEVLYDENQYILGLEYTGLDMIGLDYANQTYGSENYGDAEIGGGCSITFATYRTGITGAVRNMDLQLSNYCSYELTIHPGENVKYPVWGLAYTGMDEKGYRDILENGMTDSQYATIPFTTTDGMSFGTNDAGERASLYCAILMRTQQNDDQGNCIWDTPGTYPGAPIRCCTQSIATLIPAQCLSIDDALKYVGAVDEDYNRIFPDVEPTLDVYTFNIKTESKVLRWFECLAMEDSTGRHGVLEFIDNYPIWHEGIDYSFNFFLQDEYLYNEDGTYREKYGAGIGRYEATVPFLDKIYTIEDHMALMDGIRYSFMTYYNEDENYIGSDPLGNPVDWRTEFTGYDAWGSYYHYAVELGLDVSKADAKYKIWSRYIDTNTGEIVRIDSLDDYLKNCDHLRTCWTMNYVLDEDNYDEIMTFMRWSGLFYDGMTTNEVALTNSGWETYFRVIADPMQGRVTRWFNENIGLADTITWDMMNGK